MIHDGGEGGRGADGGFGDDLQDRVVPTLADRRVARVGLDAVVVVCVDPVARSRSHAYHRRVRDDAVRHAAVGLGGTQGVGVGARGHPALDLDQLGRGQPVDGDRDLDLQADPALQQQPACATGGHRIAVRLARAVRRRAHEVVLGEQPAFDRQRCAFRRAVHGPDEHAGPDRRATARERRLLQHVGDLVGEQSQARRQVGAVLTGAEVDVGARGDRPRAQTAGEVVGVGTEVDPDGGEISSEEPL